ncbi:hypothetical protein D3C76_919870 [compost metagenome]
MLAGVVRHLAPGNFIFFGEARDSVFVDHYTVVIVGTGDESRGSSVGARMVTHQ